MTVLSSVLLQPCVHWAVQEDRGLCSDIHLCLTHLSLCPQRCPLATITYRVGFRSRKVASLFHINLYYKASCSRPLEDFGPRQTGQGCSCGSCQMLRVLFMRCCMESVTVNMVPLHTSIRHQLLPTQPL